VERKLFSWNGSDKKRELIKHDKEGRRFCRKIINNTILCMKETVRRKQKGKVSYQ
jgi:hypothetical protein